MPIVNIDLNWLNQLLGRDYPPATIHEALDQIGCDVEEVAEIQRSRCPHCQSLVEHPLGQEEVKVCNFCGHESAVLFPCFGAQQVLRLDLLADRRAGWGACSNLLRGQRKRSFEMAVVKEHLAETTG